MATLCVCTCCTFSPTAVLRPYLHLCLSLSCQGGSTARLPPPHRPCIGDCRLPGPHHQSPLRFMASVHLLEAPLCSPVVTAGGSCGTPLARCLLCFLPQT